jgi:enolase-phosphatase E1
LFANTNCGDLSSFLHRYFDTAMGAKDLPESYRKIASALNLPAANVLFISDTVGELDAARAGEMKTAWCVRGTSTSSTVNLHATIHSFDKILP